MVSDVLRTLSPDHIYVGCAKGLDKLVREYAEKNRTPMTVFYADWDKYGKPAGHIRNKTMLESAGADAMVIAFPGGRGTENCVTTAIKLNMMVARIMP